MSSIIKLPTNIELVLHLIKEELKNNKLFSALRIAGLEDCYYQSYFGSLVLSYLGFKEDDDELIEYYQKLVDKYTEKVEADNDVVMTCALDLYGDLVNEKRRRGVTGDR
jgi:hypothetical protein